MLPQETRTSGATWHVAEQGSSPMSRKSIVAEEGSSPLSRKSIARSLTHGHEAAKNVMSGSSRMLSKRTGTMRNMLKAAHELAIETQMLQYEKDRSKQRRQLIVLVLFVLTYLLLGGLIFSIAEKWDFATGVYFATVTMSTVGYGDISPSSTGMRVFTVLYGLVGIAFFSSKIVTIIATLRELAAANVQISILNERNVTGFPMWLKVPTHLALYYVGQLVMAGIYVGVAGERLVAGERVKLDFGMAFWHACTTAMTIGYGDITSHVRTLSELSDPIWPFIGTHVT
jgi:hypothetical protein